MQGLSARTRALCAALLAGAALAAGAPPAAVAGECSTPTAYPGNDAAKPAIARWMAHGARARGIPGELPAMGALVESGLANLSYGDADRAGFFQMRTSIWNQGKYSGFPENPELQLTWFIDQAIAIRERAGFAPGDAGFVPDPGQWGEWVADIERPAEQYGGRYQLRLEEARGLIGPDCAGAPPPRAGAAPGPPSSPGAPGPALADITPPRALLSGRRTQSAGSTIAVIVSCGEEACSAVASGSVRVPKLFKLRSTTKQVVAGGKAKLRLRVPKKAQRAIRRALRRRRKVTAKIKLRVTDAAGNTQTSRRSVKIKR